MTGGTTSRADAVAALQQAARNYAKRQLTWFSNPCPDRARVQADIRRTQRPLRVVSGRPLSNPSSSEMSQKATFTHHPECDIRANSTEPPLRQSFRAGPDPQTAPKPGLD
nr:hypothetical protein [Brevundimonas subvibrioides]